PHSDIRGSQPACGSPRLIAACHVLHRLPAPRHPPRALPRLASPPFSPREKVRDRPTPRSQGALLRARASRRTPLFPSNPRCQTTGPARGRQTYKIRLPRTAVKPPVPPPLAAGSEPRPGHPLPRGARPCHPHCAGAAVPVWSPPQRNGHDTPAPEPDRDGMRGMSWARVSPRGAARWRRGHPWIYRSDVVEPPASGPGVVAVRTVDGAPLGMALWSPASTIALRMLTSEEREIGPDFWAERLEAALAYRARQGLAVEKNDAAWRVIHAEADG